VAGFGQGALANLIFGTKSRCRTPDSSIANGRPSALGALFDERMMSTMKLDATSHELRDNLTGGAEAYPC